MKKKFRQPTLKLINIEAQNILASSGNPTMNTSSSNGLAGTSFGGSTSEKGNIEVQAKQTVGRFDY